MPIKSSTLFWAPAVLLGLCLLGLIIPGLVDFTLWMVQENHPVELLTFISLFTGGVLGIKLAIYNRQRNLDWWIWTFQLLFSLALLFVAMEEIAWGQWFFGFETPAAFKKINYQGETTLHNIPGLHGRTEILRVIFGFGGLIGLALNWFPRFKPIAVPQVLWLWFIIIASHASIDYYNDNYPIDKHFDWVVMWSSEFLEMMIGFAGFLYIFLHWKNRKQIIR